MAGRGDYLLPSKERKFLMAVSFGSEKVAICCDACHTQMASLERAGLTLSEALEFADSFKESIFCKKCSEPPLVVPKNPEEFH